MEREEPTPGISSRVGLIGLLLVQAFIGYEWFMSGITKIVRGGFPSGLADELRAKSAGAAGWYKSFLDGSVIPNATAFGYLIEIGELLIGIAFVVAAFVWLFSWQRLPGGGRVALLLVTAVASFGAIFMNVNFHLANSSAHPWFIPKEGFDEGVDLDSLMPAIELVLLALSTSFLVSLRRGTKRAIRIGSPRAHGASRVQP